MSFSAFLQSYLVAWRAYQRQVLDGRINPLQLLTTTHFRRQASEVRGISECQYVVVTYLFMIRAGRKWKALVREIFHLLSVMEKTF